MPGDMIDPFDMAYRASGLSDRLLAQGAADAVAYAAELAFVREGEAREGVDAAIALAKRFAESRPLDGDASHLFELEAELKLARQLDAEGSDRGVGAGPPIVRHATSAAFWLCLLLAAFVEGHRHTVEHRLERLLSFCGLAASDAGERGGAVATFARSVNGGLRG